MKAICNKCHNVEKCKRPCYFIERMLSQVTDGSLERPTGDKEITHYGHYHEKRFSDYHEATLNKMIETITKEHNEEESEPDARRADDLEFTPTQKTADIFYMRFFKGKSYVEIGEKHGIDHRTAAGIYSQGMKRIIEILNALDGRDKAMKFCVGRCRNSLTNHEKAFLLNKVFGFAFTEIAPLLGYASPDAIQHKVNEMYHSYRKEYFPTVKKSVYDGLSVSEIKERISF